MNNAYIDIKPTTKMDLFRVNSDMKEQVKTVDCKLAQIIICIVQIWNDFYYSGHYILSHKTFSSQIIFVYTD